jgi:hypothetical protein
MTNLLLALAVLEESRLPLANKKNLWARPGSRVWRKAADVHRANPSLAWPVTRPRPFARAVGVDVKGLV